MRDMETAKMRRTLERSRALSEERARAEWLDAMTPEHRAKHDPPVGLCAECLRDQSRAAGAGLAEAFARLARP